jgi:lysozyme
MSLEQELERDEGTRTHAYQDSLGFWTIGIGRLIDARKSPSGGLSEDEIQYLLANDIKTATKNCESVFPTFLDFSQNRQEALINLMFNLGIGNISSYHTFVGQVNAHDWTAVQNNMRGWKKWRSQVGARAD